MNKELFRQRLQKMRERKRISRVVASQLCGLKNDAFRLYERGYRLPSAETLTILADFFECSIDYLLGETNDPSRPGK